MATSLLAVGVLALGGLGFGVPSAQADGVKMISGGPTGAARRSAARAFEQARTGALRVCWRRAAVVRVALTVSAGGVVKKAVHKSGGAIGQCVAGVLAVHKVARSKRGYRVVLEISAASSGGRTASAITEDLVAVRPALQRCYDRASSPKLAKPAKPGRVALRFLIKPSGRIVEPSVEESTIESSVAEHCMLRSLKAATLRPALGSKTIAFSLSMALRRGGTTATAARAGSAKGMVPKKNGPVAASVLTAVMNKQMSSFRGCAALAKGTLDGTAVVRFTIGAKGTTRNVKIKSSTLGAKRVEACLVKNAKKLRFPAEDGRAKTRVFYPFHFRR